MSEPFTYSTPQKVWITKHALDGGVYSAMAVLDIRKGHKIAITKFKTNFPQFYQPGEWQETLESALRKAELMREQKLKSLVKVISIIEQMQFKIKDEVA